MQQGHTFLSLFLRLLQLALLVVLEVALDLLVVLLLLVLCSAAAPLILREPLRLQRPPGLATPKSRGAPTPRSRVCRARGVVCVSRWLPGVRSPGLMGRPALYNSFGRKNIK